MLVKGHQVAIVNILRVEQHGHHFTQDIFSVFCNKSLIILIQNPPSSNISEGRIDNKSAYR